MRFQEYGIYNRRQTVIDAQYLVTRIRMVLCGMETPPIRGWDNTIEFQKIYPRLAQRYSVPLVPFVLALVALNPEMNGEDDVHANAAGARQIAETVWPYLEPLVRDERALAG